MIDAGPMVSPAAESRFLSSELPIARRQSDKNSLARRWRNPHALARSLHVRQSMNEEALLLLNRILDAAAPDAVICLPPFQASMLGQLTARELGRELKANMSTTSAPIALERHGLFGRRVRVVHDQADFSVNY
jgi:hypothetical protein